MAASASHFFLLDRIFLYYSNIYNFVPRFLVDIYVAGKKDYRQTK